MLVDTDIVIDLWRKHPAAVAWFASLPVPPAVPGFVSLEVLAGCRDKAARGAALTLLRDFPVCWPSESAMERALHTLSEYFQSHGLGPLDALIAATALEQGQPLATFNVRHFRVVPGLVIEQPYVR